MIKNDAPDSTWQCDQFKASDIELLSWLTNKMRPLLFKNKMTLSPHHEKINS